MGSKGQEANETRANETSTEQAQRSPSAVGAGARGLWVAALVMLMVGLVLSGELIRLHIEATSDAAYNSYCSVSETVSCDTVARSEYAIAFGVPLAVWGVFGYALMALIAGLGLRGRSRSMAAPFAGLAIFSLAVSLVLAAISHFLIQAWCLVCVGTYVVNLAVAVLSFYLLGKEGARASCRALLEQIAKERGRSRAVAGVVGGVALGLILFYPPAPEPVLLAAPQPEASGATPSTSSDAIPPLVPGTQIETGVTQDGLPWIGAANPVVTITEFFDYQCSHCRHAFHALHKLLAVNPDRLRLEVRHFPLNPDCNRFISRPIYQHSCFNAKLANCAGEQKRFWEAHEYLFERSGRKVEPTTFADALSLDAKKLDACLERDNPALDRDIEAGIALQLHGTPVFVVDGNVYVQRLPRFLSKKLRSPEGWH